MKKLMTMTMICGAMAVSACASNGSNTDYTGEVAAPYADERTVGHEEMMAAPAKTAPAPKKAEKVFHASQVK